MENPVNFLKSVHIPSFFGPYFPAFALNTEKYLSLFSPNEGKYRPRKLRIQPRKRSTVDRPANYTIHGQFVRSKNFLKVQNYTQ